MRACNMRGHGHVTLIRAHPKGFVLNVFGEIPPPTQLNIINVEDLFISYIVFIAVLSYTKLCKRFSSRTSFVYKNCKYRSFVCVQLSSLLKRPGE